MFWLAWQFLGVFIVLAALGIVWALLAGLWHFIAGLSSGGQYVPPPAVTSTPTKRAERIPLYWDRRARTLDVVPPPPSPTTRELLIKNMPPGEGR